DDAEAPLAENLEHLVMPDSTERVVPRGRLQEDESAVFVVARSFAFFSRPLAVSRSVKSLRGIGRLRRQFLDDRLLEKVAHRGISLQELLDLAAQYGIARASRVQKRGALDVGRFFEGSE